MPASFKKLRRCLIRHQYSQAWFADGRWVPNPHQADDFADLNDILQACDIYQLRDVEVVFRGLSEEMDIAVPLRSSEHQAVKGDSTPAAKPISLQTVK
jgi:hypothetical protein